MAARPRRFWPPADYCGHAFLKGFACMLLGVFYYSVTTAVLDINIAHFDTSPQKTLDLLGRGLTMPARSVPGTQQCNVVRV